MKRLILLIGFLIASAGTCAAQYAPITTHLSGPQLRSAIDDRFAGRVTIDPRLSPYPFISLPAEADGSVHWCPDCKPTIPCTGGGSGAFAFGIGSAWQCTVPAAGIVPPVGDIGGTALAPTVTNGSHLANGTVPNAALVTAPLVAASTLDATKLSGAIPAGVTGSPAIALTNATGTLPTGSTAALTGDVTKSAGSNATTLANIPALSGANLTSLNASNLSSGTVAAARGGAGAITGALKGNGAGLVAQAACADLSNGATGCSTTVAPVASSGSAADLNAGTLPAGRLPALTGDTTSSAGSAATTTTKTGGVAFAPSATTDTTNAANIASGTLSAARLPALTGDATRPAGSAVTTVVQTHLGVRKFVFSDSPVTLTSTDENVFCDATAGAIILNMPTGAVATNQRIQLSKTDATATACTLTRNGSDTIDGATTLALTTRSTVAIFNGSNNLWTRLHINQMAGDVIGASASNTVAKVNGNPVSAAAPTAAQIWAENAGATSMVPITLSGGGDCATASLGSTGVLTTTCLSSNGNAYTSAAFGSALNLSSVNVGGVINALTYGAVSSTSKMAATTTNTVVDMAVDTVGDYKVGQSIICEHCGAATALSTPAAPTVTAMTVGLGNGATTDAFPIAGCTAQTGAGTNAFVWTTNGSAIVTVSNAFFFEVGNVFSTAVAMNGPFTITGMTQSVRQVTVTPTPNATTLRTVATIATPCTTTRGYAVAAVGTNGDITAFSPTTYLATSASALNWGDWNNVSVPTITNATEYIFSACEGAACTPTPAAIVPVTYSYNGATDPYILPTAAKAVPTAIFWHDIGHPYYINQELPNDAAAPLQQNLLTTLTAVKTSGSCGAVASPCVTLTVAPSNSGAHTIWHDNAPPINTAIAAAQVTTKPGSNTKVFVPTGSYSLGQKLKNYKSVSVAFEGVTAGNMSGTEFVWRGGGTPVLDWNQLQYATIKNIMVTGGNRTNGAPGNTPSVCLDWDSFDEGGGVTIGSTALTVDGFACGESGIGIRESNIDANNTQFLVARNSQINSPIGSAVGWAGDVCVLINSGNALGNNLTQVTSVGCNVGVLNFFGGVDLETSALGGLGSIGVWNPQYSHPVIISNSRLEHGSRLYWNPIPGNGGQAPVLLYGNEMAGYNPLQDCNAVVAGGRGTAMLMGNSFAASFPDANSSGCDPVVMAESGNASLSSYNNNYSGVTYPFSTAFNEQYYVNSQGDKVNSATGVKNLGTQISGYNLNFTQVVGAPGTAAGTKLNLYPNTLGSTNINDYSLGINSSAFWFNAPAVPFDFYYAGVLGLRLDNGGGLEFRGTSTNPTGFYFMGNDGTKLLEDTPSGKSYQWSINNVAAATLTATQFAILGGANLSSSGGTLPSVGTCGTGAVVTANSTTISGSVTIGSTNPTATCPITFATACTNALNCIVSDAGTFQALKPVQTSTSVLTITAATTMHGDKVYWHCGCN